MDLKNLRINVDRLVQLLSEPVSADEANCGWSMPAKEGMRKFMTKLLSDIDHDPFFYQKLEYRTIARGLDHWGVLSGQLCDELTDISSLIRDINMELSSDIK